MVACFKTVMPHFVTGDFKPQNVFLDDSQYGLALDCLVKACTDFLILEGEGEDCRVLLGKRIVEPQPDWWFMGGRMRPGERPEDSVARLLSREMGLAVRPGALKLLGVHSYAWARRQQQPMDNGTCDISCVFTLVVPKEDAEKITMDEKEYSESRWFSIDEIIEGDFHPALQQSARDLRSRFKWEGLVKALQDGENAEVVAEKAKLLVQSQ